MILDGTEVRVPHGHQSGTFVTARTMAYIAKTDAYLCLIESGPNEGKLQAYPASMVVLPVPKFNTVEEADAWLESH